MDEATGNKIQTNDTWTRTTKYM